MERLRQRVAGAVRALATLEELTHKTTLSKVERDAAIQRFEYTFEAVWKMAQIYLREVEGLEVGSPKRAARVSLQVGLLDTAQTRQALSMADDRNLTVHTYNEEVAEEISRRLPGHAELLHVWIDRVRQRVDAASE